MYTWQYWNTACWWSNEIIRTAVCETYKLVACKNASQWYLHSTKFKPDHTLMYDYINVFVLTLTSNMPIKPATPSHSSTATETKCIYS